ncbi:MAG: hypothetical protein IJ809_01700 [Clostridia bacterium]|nr:hypothetical protein [Clostridia bacterium]
MNNIIKYFLVTIISLFIFALIIIISPTKARYTYSYGFENNLNVGYTIFDITQDENNDSFNFDDEVTYELKIKNYVKNDDEDVINTSSKAFYLKLLDKDKKELDKTVASFDEIKYISFFKDESGNIVDSNGNLIDEEGNITEERNLTEEELSKIVEVRKGFGKINLKDDKTTKEEKKLTIKLNIADSNLTSYKYYIDVYIDNPEDDSMIKYKEFEFVIKNASSDEEVDIYGENNTSNDVEVDIYNENNLENDNNNVDNESKADDEVDIYEENTTGNVDIYG